MLLQEHPQLPELTEDLKSEVERVSGASIGAGVKKKKNKKEDPNKPRHPTGSFFTWLSENRAQGGSSIDILDFG